MRRGDRGGGGGGRGKRGAEGVCMRYFVHTHTPTNIGKPHKDAYS